MEKTRIIEQYLDGTLGDDERRELEKRAMQDKDFRELIRLHKEVNESIRDKDLSTFQELVKKVSAVYFNTMAYSTQKSEKKSVWITQSLFFRLAAMLVIVAVAGIILKYTLFNDMSAEELYHKYYTTYNADVVLRSTQEDETALDRAIITYNRGQYAETLVILDEVIKIDTCNYVAQFYKGLTLLETGDGNKAIKAFQEIPIMWSNPLNEHRNWYLALAILRSRDQEEAIVAFKRISVSGGYYADRADKILQKLKP